MRRFWCIYTLVLKRHVPECHPSEIPLLNAYSAQMERWYTGLLQEKNIQTLKAAQTLCTPCYQAMLQVIQTPSEIPLLNAYSAQMERLYTGPLQEKNIQTLKAAQTLCTPCYQAMLHVIQTI